MILRLIYTSLLIFPALILQAQNDNEAKRDIFLGNNIYVVYTDNAALDSSLHESFSKFWTIRPIKGYISKKELKNLIRDEKNSFFYTASFCHNYQKYSNCATCIFAINGGKKNTGKYSLMYDAAAVEYFDVIMYENDLEKSSYRLPLMVTSLEHAINLKYDAITKVKFNKQKILAVNNELVNAKKMRDRCIDMEALAAWPGKYELLSPDKISKLVRNRDENYLLITPVLTGLASFVALYDLASMRLVGTNQNRKNSLRTPWVRSREIESLLEYVNGNQRKN